MEDREAVGDDDFPVGVVDEGVVVSAEQDGVVDGGAEVGPVHDVVGVRISSDGLHL
ncbi:MAG: hypothetical protein ACRDRH_06425 [Pseudonocardia sp.]